MTIVHALSLYRQSIKVGIPNACYVAFINITTMILIKHHYFLQVRRNTYSRQNPLVTT